MGGRGSGGARLGTGPKRRGAKAAWVAGEKPSKAATTRFVAPKGAEQPLGAVYLPEDLPTDQKAVWDALAPHATANGTLMPATCIAFRDLCEAIVIKRLMLAQIVADGLTSNRVTLQMDEAGGGLQAVEPKAHPLLSKWTALMVRVEAGMSRFRLTADGKPTAAIEEPKDEWSEFDGPRLVTKGA